MRYAIFLVVVILSSSCREISFKEPQPKGVRALEKIPKKLQGRYYLTENGSLINDILVVTENGYRFEPKDTNEKVEEFLLSDSLVLKYYRGYYFVNTRTGYNWNLRVVDRTKKGDLRILEMDNVPENEDSRNAFIARLQAELPVIKTEDNGTTYYIIDPAPAKLTELIRKEFFREKTRLVKTK